MLPPEAGDFQGGCAPLINVSFFNPAAGELQAWPLGGATIALGRCPKNKDWCGSSGSLRLGCRMRGCDYFSLRDETMFHQNSSTATSTPTEATPATGSASRWPV